MITPSVDWRVHVTSESAMGFLVEIMFILNAIKSNFRKDHIINRILHSWSFHMKFMKLTKDSFKGRFLS